MLLLFSGHWCRGGKRFKCPSGSHGKKEGLDDSRCSGLCLPGFYCREGSTTNRQFPCGNQTVYCPIGSSYPKLTGRGMYSYNSSSSSLSSDLHSKEVLTTSTMSWQHECERGYYCINGKRMQCPQGTYNNETGMSNENDCKPCLEGMSLFETNVSSTTLGLIYIYIY